MHREIDPAALRLPDGLEPDLFEGRAYEAHVPFLMEEVRPAFGGGFGPLGTFPETNLRTYVRLDGVPYVWFQRLETPRRSVNAMARRFFGLPYVHAALSIEDRDGETVYRGGLEFGDTPLVARRGEVTQGDAFDRWCVDRDTFLTRHRGRWWHGKVRHAPYELRSVEVVAPGWTRAIGCDGVDVLADPIRPLRIP